ncbi:MAG: hypothetical protein KTR31_00550 [Myxococcales bacterium]|nr:hypothetical protein [Myxococcales bacterium]
MTRRATDPNGSRFFVLRYPRDFDGAIPAAPFARESEPYLSDTLLHDPIRHVTELQPTKPSGIPARTPPAIAVQPRGDAFLATPEGQLIRRLCDGTEVAFPCEADLVRHASGLALDRRGRLYVADPVAGRVVVLSGTQGTALAVLPQAERPVDVAVTASGEVWVADGTGALHRYAPDLTWLFSIPTPADPIAVMTDGPAHDVRVLLATATHPRLLAFDTHGTALADVALSAVRADAEATTVALDTLAALYGPHALRFLATPDCYCPAGDGPSKLAAVHTSLRVARLSLGRAFESEGTFVSRRLDAREARVQWHKVVVDADVPPGTEVWVHTGTSEQANTPPTTWTAPTDLHGRPHSFSADVPDQLVLSEPGRFLWLRMTLRSSGSATPSVRAIRVIEPRNSPAELLPVHWHRDPDTHRFTQRFLALVERVTTGIEASYETFLQGLHPAAAPPELVTWLGALLDVVFDPSWSLPRRRALLQEAVDLYRVRGTPTGLSRMVEIYTGRRPVILEGFLQRPGRAPFLGVPGTVLGCGLSLCDCSEIGADAALYHAHAHRFTVVVPLPDDCDRAVTAAVIERIVQMNKPAHAEHTVQLASQAQVGLFDRVGIDWVLDAPTSLSPSPHALGGAR